MGFRDLFGKRGPIVYSEADMARYEAFVKKNIGEYEKVFHELVSPDLHIDVILVPPAPGKAFYTLVTMGMGAYKMKVPRQYGRMNRAELAMRLPESWEVFSTEEKWYWPIRTLKMLARLPYQEKSWLGLYHDADFRKPFAENTELCSVILDLFDEEMEIPTLENGDEIAVYNVIPLHRAEMDFKAKNGAEALLDRFGNRILHGPVDIGRVSRV